MKRNYILITAVCFLLAIFSIFSSNHVRVEREKSSDYSKKITQRFHWNKEDPFFKTPPMDKNFFSHFLR